MAMRFKFQIYQNLWPASQVHHNAKWPHLPTSSDTFLEFSFIRRSFTPNAVLGYLRTSRAIFAALKSRKRLVVASLAC